MVERFSRHATEQWGSAESRGKVMLYNEISIGYAFFRKRRGYGEQAF